ncbi:CARDB domain-containing protein [Paenibacillus popilliae]|uniref:Uncharacterized conserved protein n=1 Tax=Paenibacillus popilliae ATCC 14706 TaxID=1212764 RepID=M9L9I7_PAEPP|nr:CARDB domain-containing protein [Paenibacillus popilliae]GAC42087.1 uncharacterized conserved protein [Paenibacillus popilliae ATCC 14706]
MRRLISCAVAIVLMFSMNIGLVAGIYNNPWSKKIDFKAETIKLENETLYIMTTYIGDPLSASEIWELGDRFGFEGNVKVTGAVNVDPPIPINIYYNILSSYPWGIKYGDTIPLNILDLNLSGLKGGNMIIEVTGTIFPPRQPCYYMKEQGVGVEDNNTITQKLNVGNGTDLVAHSIAANPDTIKKGSKTKITAEVKNNVPNAEVQKNVPIQFKVNDEVIYSVRKDIPPGEVVHISFDWEANCVGKSVLQMIVDPDRQIKDIDRRNNLNYIHVVCEDDSGSGGKSSRSWDVYKMDISEVEHKNRVHFDTVCGLHVIGVGYYNEPIWKISKETDTKSTSSEQGGKTKQSEEDSEKVTATIEANTKQGEKTDKKNPKPSDRESRGSWEIIPYALKEKLNPNHVTRAGYGFELTANIQSKRRPSKVYARIYDTKKRVAEVKMENNTGTTTWKLPEIKYTFTHTDEKIVERKVYTGIDWPDGNFTVEVEAEFPGSHERQPVGEPITLHIYGSMHDDHQNILQANVQED